MYSRKKTIFYAAFIAKVKLILGNLIHNGWCSKGSQTNVENLAANNAIFITCV